MRGRLASSSTSPGSLPRLLSPNPPQLLTRRSSSTKYGRCVTPILEDQRAELILSAQLANCTYAYNAWYPNRQPDPQGYAFAANAPSLAGLPPVQVNVSEYDILRDSSIAFAQRLFTENEAGAELHVRPFLASGPRFLVQLTMCRFTAARIMAIRAPSRKPPSAELTIWPKSASQRGS